MTIRQGTLWFAPLPEGDWSKAILQMPGKDKKREKEAERDGPKEGSNRAGTTKNVLKLAPVRKHVVLKEGILLLREVDGNEEQIPLEGCEVSSISYDQTSNGKWYVLKSFSYLLCSGLLNSTFFFISVLMLKARDEMFYVSVMNDPPPPAVLRHCYTSRTFSISAYAFVRI